MLELRRHRKHHHACHNEQHMLINWTLSRFLQQIIEAKHTILSTRMEAPSALEVTDERVCTTEPRALVGLGKRSRATRS